MKCELVHTKEMDSKTKLQWQQLGYKLNPNAQGIEMRCHPKYKKTCVYYEPNEVQKMSVDEAEVNKVGKKHFRFECKLTEEQSKKMLLILDEINKNKSDEEKINIYRLFQMIMLNDCEKRIDEAINDFTNVKQ